MHPRLGRRPTVVCPRHFVRRLVRMLPHETMEELDVDRRVPAAPLRRGHDVARVSGVPDPFAQRAHRNREARRDLDIRLRAVFVRAHRSFA